MHLEEQIEFIKDKFQINEISKDILDIDLFPKLKLTINLKKYPKKPKFTILKSLPKLLRDFEVFVPKLRNWDQVNPPILVEIIESIKRTLKSITGTVVYISENLFKELCHISKNNHPKESFYVLRMINGILHEYIHAPQMSSSTTSAIFYPHKIGRDTSIIASFHTHPNGNFHPSQVDLQSFRMKPINIILGAPYNITSLGFYDSLGKQINFQLIGEI